jgi:DNA-binding CsgD family transcriptional regulator
MLASHSDDGSRDTARVLEISLAAPERQTFQREALDFIDGSIGYSVGFFVGGSSLVVAGAWAGYSEKLMGRLSRYGAEIEPVKVCALHHGGVAVDTEVLGLGVRRTQYYRDLVKPAGGGHSLLCFLQLRGEPQGLLMLGRESGTPFSGEDLARMRGICPALALASASYDKGQPMPETSGVVPAGLKLTPRENEIGRYLTLGYTNREIALALDTSPNTVRNQLASLFRKTEVSTRAELVARLLGH